MAFQLKSGESSANGSHEGTENDEDEQEVPRVAALGFGLFLSLFGGVFFFFPLGGYIAALSSANGLGEILFFTLFFGVFLVVGGSLLVFGLASLYAGITGRHLPTYSTADREDIPEDVRAQSSTFTYSTREDLLAQIHDGNNKPSNELNTEAESADSQADEAFSDEHQPGEGAFWNIASEN
jgi:hypothetical protein